MIISDHHEPKRELPDALAIICPKRQGDPYPDKNLAGVGLAYKIAEALLSMKPEPFIRLDEWVDLVAVGTVADVVPLVGENRALVRAGLQMLKEEGGRDCCLWPGRRILLLKRSQQETLVLFLAHA